MSPFIRWVIPQPAGAVAGRGDQLHGINLLLLCLSCQAAENDILWGITRDRRPPRSRPTIRLAGDPASSVSLVVLWQTLVAWTLRRNLIWGLRLGDLVRSLRLRHLVSLRRHRLHARPLSSLDCAYPLELGTRPQEMNIECRARMTDLWPC